MEKRFFSGGRGTGMWRRRGSYDDRQTDMQIGQDSELAKILCCTKVMVILCILMFFFKAIYKLAWSFLV